MHVIDRERPRVCPAWPPSAPRAVSRGNRGRRADTDLAVRIQQRRVELRALAEKIGEIESEADEHRCVGLTTRTNAQPRYQDTPGRG